MSKHTPGPWRNEGFAVYGPGDTQIYHTGFGLLPPTRSEEAAANARLIAAAPAMAETLQRSAFVLAEIADGLTGENRDRLDQLRKLIIKTIEQATPEHYGIKPMKGK